MSELIINNFLFSKRTTIKDLSRNSKIDLWIHASNKDYLKSKNVQIFYILQSDWWKRMSELFMIWNSYDGIGNLNFSFYINHHRDLFLSLNHYDDQTFTGTYESLLVVNNNLEIAYQKHPLFSNEKIPHLIHWVNQAASLLHTQLLNIISEFVNEIKHYCLLKNMKIKDKLSAGQLDSWQFLENIRNIYNHFRSVDTGKNLYSKKLQSIINFSFKTKSSDFDDLAKIKFSKDDDHWEKIIEVYLKVFSKIAQELIK